LKEKKKLLNDEIKANKVQLITDQGKNLGEMYLSEAKDKAREENLDLMEI
jgi:translation initiation factor IF-3